MKQIRYAVARRGALECFLADGRIEIDSNTVERAIRPQTITPKNSLFAGSDGGGRTWATIATLLATASGLIHSDDSQMERSSSSSGHESRNCRERHPSGPPST